MNPKKPQSIIALAIAGLVNPESITVQAHHVTPYSKLAVDHDGFKLHHGTASGGQQVHTVRSKIISMAGGKHAVNIKLGNGGSMTIPAPDAEVWAAQILSELATVNQGAGTTATL